MGLIPHKVRSVILRLDHTGYFQKIKQSENFVNVDGADVQSQFSPGDIFQFEWPRISIGHKVRSTVLLVEGRAGALSTEDSSAYPLRFDGKAYFIPPLTMKENAGLLKRLNALAKIGRFLSQPLAIALIVMVVINVILSLAMLFGVKLQVTNGIPRPVVTP